MCQNRADRDELCLCVGTSYLWPWVEDDHVIWMESIFEGQTGRQTSFGSKYLVFHTIVVAACIISNFSRLWILAICSPEAKSMNIARKACWLDNISLHYLLAFGTTRNHPMLSRQSELAGVVQRG